MVKKKLISIAANIFLIFIGILTAILITEYTLKHQLFIRFPLTIDGHFDYNEQYRLAALSRGDTYDSRTLVQLISSERLQQKRVFPAASPAYFLNQSEGSNVKLNGRPILPVGITALADNYYCNESGQFAKFKTDQYGFRNEASAWSEPPDIVAIGDSFTLGSCLDEPSSLVGQIRQSGKKILNLGMGSNGPLIELASLKEFGLAMKPKIILWNFFANDITDLLNEKNNPILIQYLNQNFTQNLKAQSKQMNTAVDQAVEDYWQKIETLEKKRPPVTPSHFLAFENIQKFYRYFKNKPQPSEPSFQEALELFSKIISEANNESKKINAQLFFVYLPDCSDRSYGQSKWKSQLLTSLKKLEIPVIDLTDTFEEIKKTGSETFFACPGSHFNITGARITAEKILQEITNHKN